MKTQAVINGREEKGNHFFSLVEAHKWCGPATAVSLIAFFLIMRAFNLQDILELRYLNIVFLAAGILLALTQYKKHFSPDGIDYLTGIRLGVGVSLMATIPFAIFMTGYLLLDANFMDYIKSNTAFGDILNPWLAGGSIVFEGLSSGVIITFMSMQYLKRE